jgi:hypothetical protein
VEIQRRIISHDNPDGDINNSELELAASVAQHDILAQQFDVREATIHNSSDNIATVCWQRKGATSSNGPNARLLCLQSLHQRHYRYVPLFDYIAGAVNTMSTRTCPRGTILFPCSKSLVKDTETEACPPATTPSKLAQWKTASVQCDKRLPDWGGGPQERRAW